MLTVYQNLRTITDHWIRGVALLYNSRALEALPPFLFINCVNLLVLIYGVVVLRVTRLLLLQITL